jgi:hypothetical protein
MILQEPFGWVWEVRFKDIQKQKISTTGNTRYYTAANAQQEDQYVTRKDALEQLKEEYLLVNKIADAIVNNELANDSQRDYSTDQLVQTIKEKYYPPANDTQINSVLSNLADRIDRIATMTNRPSPDLQVTMWQSRGRYNYLHGISDDDNPSWYRYRPRL